MPVSANRILDLELQLDAIIFRLWSPLGVRADVLDENIIADKVVDDIIGGRTVIGRRHYHEQHHYWALVTSVAATEES